MKCKPKQSTVKLFQFESLSIDKSLRQDVFKDLSLEIRIYIVLKAELVFIWNN